MLPPPYPPSPFGYPNPAVPYHVAGAFVAWGWFRSLFNVAAQTFVADMEACAQAGPGRMA